MHLVQEAEADRSGYKSCSQIQSVRLAVGGATRFRQARRKLLWRSNRPHRLFQRGIRGPASLDRRACVRRSRRAVPVPPGSGQQPSWIFHWVDAGRLSRRPCCLDCLHASIRHLARPLCLWREDPARTDRDWPIAWPQARRGGNRRPGRLGNGAHALS